MGEAEKRLWYGLRRGALGFRFRRQYAVSNYILDFYCPKAKVAVEVDGDFHDREKDAERDAALLALGIVTVRVPTGELYPNARGALDLVWKVCTEPTNVKPPLRFPLRNQTNRKRKTTV